MKFHVPNTFKHLRVLAIMATGWELGFVHAISLVFDKMKLLEELEKNIKHSKLTSSHIVLLHLAK